MISLTDTGSPAETANASNLLAIIADPAAAKKRLDDLTAQAQRSIEAMNNARQAATEATQKSAAAAAALIDAKAAEDRYKALAIQIDQREQAVMARDKDISAREVAHAADVTAFEAKSADRETALAAREQAVSDRESKVVETQAAVQALKDQYETKVTALDSALSKAKEI